MINRLIFFILLKIFSINMYVVNAQNFSLGIRAGLNFTKPFDDKDFPNSSFGVGFGWHTSINTIWALNKRWRLSGGIIVNKLVFEESRGNLVFPTDIMHGTSTTLARSVNIYEVGGQSSIEFNFLENFKFFSPTIGLSFSKLLGNEISTTVKEGHGPVVGPDNVQVPDFVFRFIFGFNIKTKINNNTTLGISPLFIFSPYLIQTKDQLPIPPFKPNNLSLQFFVEHNLR